jgi:hypothetical protein
VNRYLGQFLADPHAVGKASRIMRILVSADTPPPHAEIAGLLPAAGDIAGT